MHNNTGNKLPNGNNGMHPTKGNLTSPVLRDIEKMMESTQAHVTVMYGRTGSQNFPRYVE
jgi:hypothetical protein